MSMIDPKKKTLHPKTLQDNYRDRAILYSFTTKSRSQNFVNQNIFLKGKPKINIVQNNLISLNWCEIFSKSKVSGFCPCRSKNRYGIRARADSFFYQSITTIPSLQSWQVRVRKTLPCVLRTVAPVKLCICRATT